MTALALKVIEGGRGDEQRALVRELYAKFGGSVLGRCVYLLKDRPRAEDAMQDVFAKVLINVSEFRAEASPLTWLMKIATHHCLNELRGQRAGWRKQFEADAQAEGEAHGGPEVFEAKDQLRKLLERFDLETQRAVVHYHLDGMTLEEVGALLGRSVPTVRKRLETFASATKQEVRS